MELNQIFTGGLQNAQAKMGELLHKPVVLSLRSAQVGGWESVPSLDGLDLLVPVSYGQAVSGTGVLMLDSRYAALIAEFMFENDSAELPSELSELQTTAAAELLSQMVAAMGEGVSKASGKSVHLVAGDPVSVGSNGASVAHGQIKEERLGIVECELTLGAHPPTKIIHLLPGSAADSLVSGDAGAAAAVAGGGVSVASGAGSQSVQVAQFGTFGAPAGPAAGAPASVGNLDLLMDVPLEITVELGRANRRMRDVLALGPGSILELSKLAGESVDLLVNGKPIAKGEVVVIDENFAVRIVEILSREERIPGGL